MKSNSILHPVIELLYLAIIATITLICGALYLRCGIDLVLTITFPCIVFGVYTINRYTDSEDLLNNPDKNEFFKNNNFWLSLSIFFFSFSIFGLLWFKRLTVYHLLLVIFGIAYSVKIIPIITKNRKIIFKRLKDIPLAKSFVVAFFLGTSFFFIYWQVFPNMITNKLQVILITISFILGIFMNTNFADLRDKIGDEAASVPTIPVLYGNKNTYQYTMIIPGTIWLIFTPILWYYEIISTGIALFFLVNLLYPALYITLYYLKSFPKKFVEPIADACVLVYAAGLLYLRYIY